MADMKIPNNKIPDIKKNPGNFNAGSNMMNNKIPSQNSSTKNMDKEDSSSSKGELLKNGINNAKRELKKDAIALGAAVLTDGAIAPEATKKALDTKLGNAVVDSIQTPTEKYRNNKTKIRSKREAEGLDPNYPMLWYDALPMSGKFILYGGIATAFFILMLIAMFAAIIQQDDMFKKQSFSEISSTITTDSSFGMTGTGNNTSNETGTGLIGDIISNIKDKISNAFKGIFNGTVIEEYLNLGNVFTDEPKCNGEECNSRAEVKYYQKIADISYRYKNLYNVELDWPLIIATNLNRSNDTIASFEANLNDYSTDSINDLNNVMNLDWEYDYKNISGYRYLSSINSMYDLQILAKNMVTKTTIQTCVSGGKTIATKTSIDIEDSKLVSGNSEYLECTTGTYNTSSTYKIDLDKYDEFMLEYLEYKNFIPDDTEYNGQIGSISGTNLSNAFINVAANELGTSSKDKFWNYMGYKSRVAWCAAFVSWVANNTTYNGQKLYPNVIKVKTASTVVYMNYFHNSADSNINFYYNDSCSTYSNKNNGKYTPKEGDIIFFNWKKTWNGDFKNIYVGSGNVNHVGIVKNYSNGKITTIEGNSSDNVRERSYSINDCRVIGFGSWY